MKLEMLNWSVNDHVGAHTHAIKLKEECLSIGIYLLQACILMVNYRGKLMPKLS